VTRIDSTIRDVALELALDFIPELVDLLADDRLVGRRHRLPARCGDAWLPAGRVRLPLTAVGWAHPVIDRFWRNLLIVGVALNIAVAGESLWHLWAAMVVACAWLLLT
jgi:hypothetical protein